MIAKIPLHLCLTFGLLTGSLPAKDATPEEKAAEYLEGLTKGDSHAIMVLYAREGKILYHHGFGFANIEEKIQPNATAPWFSHAPPAGSDKNIAPLAIITKFRIGSVTKQFTAAAILKLAEAGKLSLTDPLAKYFPDIPNAKEITLRQLLTHTSGIRSFTDRPNFLQQVIQPTTPAALIKSMQDDTPDFAPGKGFHYNNSAYFLAGEIVAQVSGKSFDTYLEETFFKPLVMQSTGIYDNANPPPRVAKGYEVTDGVAKPALDWDMSWAGGAGALYSTAEDLFKWNEALHNGKILNAASYKAMTTPVTLPEGVEGMRYGYGLVMGELGGLPIIDHSGGLNGWSSDLLYFPAQRTTVIVLANALPTIKGLEPTAIAQSIAKNVLAAEIKKIPAPTIDPKVDPKTYAALAGRYDYKTAILTVTVEGDKLYAQLTGQEKYEIVPSAPREFFWKVTDAKVKFIANEKGEITAAQHSQNGTTFNAVRLPAADEIKLTEAEFNAILGDYQYSPAMTLTVTRKDNQIFAKMTNQPEATIFPKSATEFAWKIVPASIEFIKDKEGKVTKAIHHQGGQNIEAPKVK
jgi:CubicO group peptidase (beta-lactamase class C family)